MTSKWHFAKCVIRTSEKNNKKSGGLDTNLSNCPEIHRSLNDRSTVVTYTELVL